MLSIDLTGKRAFIAGVADDGGFGFAIAKALAEAGASVCVGTWPPALGIFQTLLRRGKLDAIARPGRRSQDGVRAHRSPRRRVRRPRSSPGRRAREQALQGARRLHHPGLRRPTARGLRRAVPRRRRPLARQRPGGLEGPARDEPPGLPRRRERERVLAGRDGAALRPARSPGRLVPEPLVHGERARLPGLRRRHVEREGGARERHARARLGGGSQVGPSRQLHQRGSVRVAGRERHRRRAPSRPGRRSPSRSSSR